jgi:hypothetical protein
MALGACNLKSRVHELLHTLVFLLPSIAWANTLCIEDLEKRIHSLSAVQNYAEALSVAEEFDQETLIHFGVRSECHARALSQRATLLWLQNHPAESGPLFEQALAIYRAELPADDPAVTLALTYLGDQRFWMRQYTEAARLHEEALDLRRKRRPLQRSCRMIIRGRRRTLPRRW